MKFIDLFAGIGGFHLRLERANESSKVLEFGFERSNNNSISDVSKSSNDSATQQKGEDNKIQSKKDSRNFETTKRKHSQFSCVWANEWDKYAAEIYKKNFPGTELSTADIRTINTKRLPNFDLLCAGFPCQAFSIAGKRKGFDDTRGTLFFEIARIIKAKQPKIVLLENVKGLLSHEAGRTFGRIIQVLGELGYWVEWQVLNSKDFGVPQNRERVFIVGHLREEGGQAIFPIGEINKDITKESGNRGFRKEIASALRARDYKDGTNFIQEGGRLKYVGAIMSKRNQKWLEDGKELSRNFPQGQRVYSPNGIASSICGDAGGLGGKTGLYLTTATKKGYCEAIEGDGIRLQFPESKTARGRVIKGVSQTLQTSGEVGTIQNKQIRRLTPTECERLQGFPNGWTAGLSDTQRYKCLGNAVTVNVIEEIGQSIKECGRNG